MDNAVIECAELPEEERPSAMAFSYTTHLLDLLEETVALDHLELWPTDNCTIMFSIRHNKDNQFILESGSDGISGVIKVSGKSELIRKVDASSQRLRRSLQGFANHS
ncbi:hypothetical protein CRD60_08010 [Bifidobacterium aemilianum]|uniref:Uncharacterized protein n=1 Tax=Bifidobacterium aemilianum TaxID=2493120 RepID=A0A366K6B8_9BIFI|nr:hypothetical protein [Bifidobacterium aemilianum]RBP97204.1 hypothetical protein CRD60_08010 [Bifidobacterium aemilianum]